VKVVARSKTLEGLGFLSEPSKQPVVKFAATNLQNVKTTIASLGDIE